MLPPSAVGLFGWPRALERDGHAPFPVSRWQATCLPQDHDFAFIRK